MKFRLLDADVLLYAYSTDSLHHEICYGGWSCYSTPPSPSRCRGPRFSRHFTSRPIRAPHSDERYRGSPARHPNVMIATAAERFWTPVRMLALHGQVTADSLNARVG